MARGIDDGYPGKCTTNASLLGKVPETVPCSMIPIVSLPSSTVKLQETERLSTSTFLANATRWRIRSCVCSNRIQLM